jgi:DNA-binding LytR/AlgR family response regulator
MKLKSLIVDDESAARSRLRKMLEEFPQIAIAGEARDGIEAVAAIERDRPDLVFLDVQMPGLDGFEVLRSLPAGTKWPLIVFATAYDQYALAAFEANAVGYLLKPVNRDKLRAAVERATLLAQNPRDVSQETSRLRKLADAARTEMHHVVGRLRDRFLLISLEDVCFFRVEDGLTKVKTKTAWYRTDYNIGDLESRLPDPPFFRAHRSAIVNLRMIREITPMFKGTYVLIMKDQEASEIQVSERQSKHVRELLQG